MRIGASVYVPDCGAGEIWYRRPTGEWMVRLFASNEYVTVAGAVLVPLLPRHEAAALKQGDEVQDVYGNRVTVLEVMETGAQPPAFVVALPDHAHHIRMWNELSALVRVP